MLFFSIYDENKNKISRKNRFRTVASPALGRLELMLVDYEAISDKFSMTLMINERIYYYLSVDLSC